MPKDLYVASCIEDLNKRHGIPDMKHKKCKLLCITASKLYDQAEYNNKMGDHELAYTFYMKYLNIIHVIRSSNEYKMNKPEINKLLNMSNINEALNYAEELSISLTSRYEERRKKEELLRKKIEYEQQEMIMKKFHREVPNHSNKYITPVFREIPDEPSAITCNFLYGMMGGTHTYLIIDTRHSSDFDTSHIISAYSIHIPEELINPGKSAGQLERSILDAEFKRLWDARGAVDYIVLVDWEGDPVNWSAPLRDVFRALVEWDPHVTYKRDPVALEGGFSAFRLMYPTLCTNPHLVARPTNFKENDQNCLDDIEYPNLHNLEIKTEDVKPNIDRNSKVLAVQTYDERKRNLAELLSEQEKNVDNSILLEKRRLHAEHEWECLRLKREREAEEEKRLEIQEHLQLLQQTIMQMDSFQRDKIMENESLRKELEEYKRKDIEKKHHGDKISREEAIELERTCEKRIQEKQREREKLDKQRENLAKERHRILEEAKAKKQESMKRYEEASFVNTKDEISELSGLRRSLSTPNVAQLDLDVNLKHNVPQYDRTVKPSSTIRTMHDYNNKQDFDNTTGKPGRGLCGLRNLGNTCYMNSILQCLSNTYYLVQYFFDGAYREHLHRNNDTKGKIAEELAGVIRILWNGQYKIVSCKDFRNAVAQHHKLFRGSDQQDSHEFLTILMDWLHSDLQVHRPRTHLDAHTPSDKAWKDYTKDRDSLILKMFYGQIRSTVTCTHCYKESVTFDTFSNLSLELPGDGDRCSLRECLNLYSNDERISGWKCPVCQLNRDAVKKLDISKLPPILVIHFKRFYVDRYTSRTYHKKQTYIDFPIVDLNMASLEGTKQYNLYAVSNHYGSMESGHYTAYCKSSVYNKWYKFDDQIVSAIDPGDVNSSAAYILFYTAFPQRNNSRN